MPRFTVELSDEAARVIEAELSAGRQPSAAAYLEELLRSEESRRVEQERFEQLIEEGMASGPGIPVDEEFWVERRRQLEETVAKRLK